MYRYYKTVCTNCVVGDRCKVVNTTLGRYPEECLEMCDLYRFSVGCNTAAFQLTQPLESRCTLYDCGDLTVDPNAGQLVYSLMKYEEMDFGFAPGIIC